MLDFASSEQSYDASEKSIDFEALDRQHSEPSSPDKGTPNQNSANHGTNGSAHDTNSAASQKSLDFDSGAQSEKSLDFEQNNGTGARSEKSLDFETRSQASHGDGGGSEKSIDFERMSHRAGDRNDASFDADRVSVGVGSECVCCEICY